MHWRTCLPTKRRRPKRTSWCWKPCTKSTPCSIPWRPLVKRAFLLSQINGLKYDDIAEQLGVSLITVKRYMKQAFVQCLMLVE